MCLVRSGGKKLQRRFAGWWPAANKAERLRKARVSRGRSRNGFTFPVRSMVMRLFKLAVHAIGRRYSSCNLPRWNAIETIPVILAFQRAFNRACRVLYQNGNRANGFEREKEKFSREAGREGGPRLRTRRTPSRKLFAVLSANRVNLHKSRGDNNRA